MAFPAYPYSVADFIDQLLPKWKEASFDDQRFDENSMLGSGHNIPAEMAVPKWKVSMIFAELERDESMFLETRIRKLQGQQYSLMVYDPRRRYPKDDPLGVLLSGVSPVAVGGVAASGSFATSAYTYEGVTGTFSGISSMVRGSVAYALNSSGSYAQSAVNVLRMNYSSAAVLLGAFLEVSRTNSIRNNSMVGASAPSTAPTNWSTGSNAGLTREIIGVGTENGLPYMDVRWSGTSTSSGPVTLNMDASSFIAAAVGQVWAYSIFEKVIAAPSPPSSYGLRLTEQDSGGATLINRDVTSIGTVNGTFQRFTANTSITLSDAATAYIRPVIRFSIANATVYDWTVRIYCPQLERIVSGPAAMSSPILTTSAAVTRSADALTINAKGTNNWVLTFDDASTQAFNGVVGNFTIDPAALNRQNIISYTATRVTMPTPSTLAVKVNTIGADGQSISLKGLSPGFAFNIGDKGQISFGTDRNYFFEFSEAGSATFAGITPELQVWPHVPISIVADTDINLIKPACKMTIESKNVGRAASYWSTGASLDLLEHI